MIEKTEHIHKILLLSDLEVKTQIQARWYEQIVRLKNNLSFIYYEGRIYEVYLPQEIKQFLEIYTKVLIFPDPTDLKIKMLDLNTNKLNPNFQFRSSENVSDESNREIIIYRFRVFFLDCEEKQIKYLISQDLEKHYSFNNVCHFNIRILPLNYSPDTQFNLEIVARYDYAKRLGQTDLYYWQVDIETWAIYEQDNEQNKFEILLIKPHLLIMHFILFTLNLKIPSQFQMFQIGLILIKLLFGLIVMMLQLNQAYLFLIQQSIMMDKIGYLNLNLRQIQQTIMLLMNHKFSQILINLTQDLLILFK